MFLLHTYIVLITNVFFKKIETLNQIGGDGTTANSSSVDWNILFD